MTTITLYRFNVRSPGENWTQTRYRMTLEDAAARYGVGNYELMEYTIEEGEGGPTANSAAHLQSSPGMPKR